MSFTTVCLRSQQGEEKRESGSSLESVSCVTGVFLYTLHPSSLLNLTCVVMTEICAVKEFTVVLFNVEMLMIIQLSVASAKWLNHERESSFMATLWRTWLWLLSYCVPRYCVYLRIYIYIKYIFTHCSEWLCCFTALQSLVQSWTQVSVCVEFLHEWVSSGFSRFLSLGKNKPVVGLATLNCSIFVNECVWMSVID